MANATGYRRGTVTTAPFIDATSTCTNGQIQWSCDTPYIAYNGTYYLCSVAHTTTGTPQPPKLYYAGDPTVEPWTQNGDLSTFDATWTNNSNNAAVLTASDNNFVVVAMYNHSGAGNWDGKMGVCAVDGTTLARTYTELYNGTGVHAQSSGINTAACFDTAGNLWVAHPEGVTRCTGYTTPVTSIGWDNLADDLSVAAGADWSNYCIVPLASGKVMVIFKFLQQATANYPTRAYLYDGTGDVDTGPATPGSGWTLSLTRTTTANTRDCVAATGDTTNDKAYVMWGTRDATDEWDFYIYDASAGGAWSQITTTWDTDRGYETGSTLVNFPSCLNMCMHGDRVLVAVNIFATGVANFCVASDIWACDLDGANWYVVGHAGHGEEAYGFGTTGTPLRRLSLPETLDTSEAPYALCCGTYGVWFKDFGNRRPRIHTNEGRQYANANLRGTGPGRHTCYKNGKFWFVWREAAGIGTAARYAYSDDGYDWTAADLHANATPYAIVPDDLSDTIYALFINSTDNHMSGLEIDSSDGTLSSVVDITSTAELAARRGSMVQSPLDGSIWVAIGSNHATEVGNTSRGRVWTCAHGDFLTGPWTEYDFMANHRRLGRCPELAAMSNGDLLLIDPRGGTGQAEVHFYDQGTDTWTESEDNVTWSDSATGFGKVSAVVDKDDTVHFVTGAAGPNVLYHQRTSAGVYTKDTDMSTEFISYNTLYDQPIITYNAHADRVRIYANYRETTTSTPICWTDSTDGGATWGSAEMHSLDMEFTGASPELFKSLYVPMYETESPYLIKSVCTSPDDSTADGATIFFFPRTQLMGHGKGWRDCRQQSNVGGYPVSYL